MPVSDKILFIEQRVMELSPVYCRVQHGVFVGSCEYTNVFGFGLRGLFQAEVLKGVGTGACEGAGHTFGHFRCLVAVFGVYCVLYCRAAEGGYGTPAGSVRLKNLRTKSKRLTVSCRVIWACSEMVDM